MTFCLGLKSAEGLLAIADTRITSGSMEVSSAPKIAVREFSGGSLFVLTSGLRSLRDKALTYFDAEGSNGASPPTRAYEAVNSLAQQMRRARAEDSEWLRESNLVFDLNCIVGGSLANDARSGLFHLYPEGNWVEVEAATPYVIIGDSRYGKPILSHLWSFEMSLEKGLRAGLLAFAETRSSTSNVDYPADVVLLRDSDGEVAEMRIPEEDGAAFEEKWRQALGDAAGRLSPFVSRLYARLAGERSGLDWQEKLTR